MASALYPKTKAEMMKGNVDLLTEVVRAVLVDTDVYTYSAAHANYTDLSGVVGNESPPLTAKTISDLAVFDAADIVLALVTGNEAEALVLFLDTGVALNDLLLGYIDSATGLPVIPNGTDVNVAWNASGIFQL